MPPYGSDVITVAHFRLPRQILCLLRPILFRNMVYEMSVSFNEKATGNISSFNDKIMGNITSL